MDAMKNTKKRNEALFNDYKSQIVAQEESDDELEGRSIHQEIDYQDKKKA